MPIGVYSTDWKFKAFCKHPNCGVPLSSSTSKTSGFCYEHDVRISKKGPRR